MAVLTTVGIIFRQDIWLHDTLTMIIAGILAFEDWHDKRRAFPD